MERDLGSFAAAWTHRSPSRAGGIQRVSRQCRKVGECGRALSGEAESVVEKDGPNPTVTVSPRGRGRRPRRCPPAAPVVRSQSVRSPRPAVIRDAAARPGAEHGLHGLHVRGRDVECRERQPVLCRRRDPGLMLAIERHLAGGRWRTRSRSPAATRTRHCPRQQRRPHRARRRGSGAGGPDADVDFGHPLTTLLATRDEGLGDRLYGLGQLS